jgi:FkbM family methyltransferase
VNFLGILRRKIATVGRWRPWFANSYEVLKACFVFLTGRRGGPLSRVIVPLRLVDDVHPVYVRCASSDFVTLQEVIVDREYESVLPHAPDFVRGILDLGANTGLASRWFLRRWPSAHVIAVEPDPGNIGMLRRNLASAGQPSQPHQIIQAFAGGKARDAVLQTRGEGYANEGILSDAAPRHGQSVLPVFTPSKLLDLSTLPIDLVKIDIEGTEKEVLEGDLAWLDKVSVVVLELHDPLDEHWLHKIVTDRLPCWTISSYDRRHSGAHLAILSRKPDSDR